MRDHACPHCGSTDTDYDNPDPVDGDDDVLDRVCNSCGHVDEYR